MKGKKLDLTNKRFGRLTAIKPTDKRSNGKIVWFCVCDCGKTVYVNSTNLKHGRQLSCGCSKKGINKNESNGMWKGADVTLQGLHRWVESRKPKPEFCEFCGIIPPYDLANISQEYHRDINDFEWLCRRCHMIKDGRLNILHGGNKMIDHEKFCWECIVCGKKVISKEKPEKCPCSNNGQYCLNGNLVVTK